MKFQTPEGGCMWPHHVESPICVYDRESFEKYKSGEYQLPTHCICGVELSYDDLNSICICLVEEQRQTGDIILHTPYPLEIEAHEVPDRIRKMIEQDLGMSMGCKVEPNPVAYGLRHIDRITVRCKITGNELEACALPNGIVRWSCPCGFRYEKMISELGLAPDEILIDEYCEGKEHGQGSKTHQTSAQVQKEED